MYGKRESWKRKEQSGYREIYTKRYSCKISFLFAIYLYSIKGDKSTFCP